jgi:hypothetical protein
MERHYSNLLTTGNPKTAKGEGAGYFTAVLHLAPYKAAGLQVCPMADLAGCAAGCLNTAGRGGIAAGRATYAPHGVEVPRNAVQAARIARTRWYAEDRDGFMAALVQAIAAHIRTAEKHGLIPAVRLNGTSDIAWETIEIRRVDASGAPIVYRNVFDRFAGVQFYDYTKIPARLRRYGEGKLPANYHLTGSYSEASADYLALIAPAFDEGAANFAAVFAVGRGRPLPETFKGRQVIDGDATDLRFLDPRGVVVGLRAKGRAMRDRSGFVIR